MKGIAIQTILLLLVGILVVGILVYLVYTYTTGSTLSKYECQTNVINWCTRMRMSQYWPDPPGGCSCDDGTCLGSGCCAAYPNCQWNQWVKKCVKSDTDWHWNFDPSATASEYDNHASTYCPRVGVS